MNVPMRVVGVGVTGGAGKGGGAMPAVKLFKNKHPKWGGVESEDEEDGDIQPDMLSTGPGRDTPTSPLPNTNTNISSPSLPPLYSPFPLPPSVSSPAAYAMNFALSHPHAYLTPLSPDCPPELELARLVRASMGSDLGGHLLEVRACERSL